MPNFANTVSDIDPASLQYLGLPGISSSCLSSIRALIQLGRPIGYALILTCEREHAFLFGLGHDSEELLIVKAGFTSGYPGEGPRTLAEALELLQAFDVEIEECIVPNRLMKRLGASALKADDLSYIQKAGVVRPMRWFDYIYPWQEKTKSEEATLAAFPEVMPWAVIDARIADLARTFFDSQDDCIGRGFRRLEDVVRDHSGLQEHGVKLMQQAFMQDDSPLVWKVRCPSEQKGRAQLFVGTFMAYRNPRAHRELGEVGGTRLLAEFLVLNQLFLLERLAVRRSTL